MSDLMWKGNVFEQRKSDNYVCLTQMAKIFDKKVSHWIGTNSYMAYLEAVSLETGIPASNLMILIKGKGNVVEQGTWAHPLIAIAFAQWLSPEFHVWCNFHIKQLIESSQPRQEVKQLPEVTEKTVEIFVHGIEFFTNSGDMQLAQLLKNQFGNTMLASQQRGLPSAEPVEQLEGVIDVAIRLGFRVPKNYESPLGKYVKRYCEHLLRGKNNRYSNASSKQINANMYPAFNTEVEKAVTAFCVEKALPNNEIILD